MKNILVVIALFFSMESIACSCLSVPDPEVKTEFLGVPIEGEAIYPLTDSERKLWKAKGSTSTKFKVLVSLNSGLEPGETVEIEQKYSGCMHYFFPGGKYRIHYKSSGEYVGYCLINVESIPEYGGQ